MRSVIPDAVIQVLAIQRTILFGECPEFRPFPYPGANLPIGNHAQNCAQYGPDCKTRPIDCHFTFLRSDDDAPRRMYAYSPFLVPVRFVYLIKTAMRYGRWLRKAARATVGGAAQQEIRGSVGMTEGRAALRFASGVGRENCRSLHCATPDFLSSSVGPANFMRLSLKKAAHMALGGARNRKSGFAAVGMTKGRARRFDLHQMLIGRTADRRFFLIDCWRSRRRRLQLPLEPSTERCRERCPGSGWPKR
jgi:hypothetical protein